MRPLTQCLCLTEGRYPSPVALTHHPGSSCHHHYLCKSQHVNGTILIAPTNCFLRPGMGTLPWAQVPQEPGKAVPCCTWRSRDLPSPKLGKVQPGVQQCWKPMGFKEQVSNRGDNSGAKVQLQNGKSNMSCWLQGLEACQHCGVTDLQGVLGVPAEPGTSLAQHLSWASQPQPSTHYGLEESGHRASPRGEIQMFRHFFY